MTRERSAAMLTSKFDRERALEILPKMKDLFGNDSLDTNYRDLADALETPAGSLLRIKGDFVEAGVVVIRNGQKPSRKTGHNSGGGRASWWSMPHDVATSKAMLEDYWWKNDPKNKRTTSARVVATSVIEAPAAEARQAFEVPIPVAVRKENGEEIEAIAGPDVKPDWKEQLSTYKRTQLEDEALVEAAKQYHDRMKILRTKLDELAALGVHINPDSIQYDVDDRLEAISSVVPYIRGLENKLAILRSQLADATSKMGELRKYQNEATKLREQNQRLIAKQVSA